MLQKGFNKMYPLTSRLTFANFIKLNGFLKTRAKNQTAWLVISVDDKLCMLCKTQIPWIPPQVPIECYKCLTY